MKKLLIMSLLCLAAVACGNGSGKKTETEKQSTEDRVEILYFHGKQRCATCIAIEQETKAVMETAYAEELKDGRLVFRIIDISQKENEAIADKYQVTWSSLFICKWKDGKEKYENLTEFAFANARTSPDKFRTDLTEKIREYLQ